MLRDEAKSILEPKLQGRMKSSKTKWKLRIVGYGEEAPEKILSNPYNYRLHPKSQHDALRTVLNDSGIVQTVIINKTTGRLIDGHLRVELARREKQPSIPVTYVELTEEEEKKILAVLDPITSMATQDQDKLYTLIKDIGNSLPQELLTALHGKVALPVDSSLQMEDHNLGVTDAVYQLREDAIFPSSNDGAAIGSIFTRTDRRPLSKSIVPKTAVLLIRKLGRDYGHHVLSVNGVIYDPELSKPYSVKSYCRRDWILLGYFECQL